MWHISYNNWNFNYTITTIKSKLACSVTIVLSVFPSMRPSMTSDCVSTIFGLINWLLRPPTVCERSRVDRHSWLLVLQLATDYVDVECLLRVYLRFNDIVSAAISILMMAAGQGYIWCVGCSVWRLWFECTFVPMNWIVHCGSGMVVWGMLET